MREVYPSDISRKQFDLIRSDLESARKRTSPRSVDLYDVFCGVLYILKSGAQWRMLPKTYPEYKFWGNYVTIISRSGARKKTNNLIAFLRKF
jgi:transposase